nr:hypothetical protein [uncultured archaeon]
MRTPIRILGLVIVVVILIFMCSLTGGEMGYEVVVTVDNTTWSIERSTLNLIFQNEGEVKGTGMVMRDSSINNIAGVSENEITHTLGGKIFISENTSLVMKEGPVVIMTNIKGGDVTTNESVNITTNESVNVTIREAWPTFLSTTKTITYVGPGIRTRERYENNGDVICTSFDVKALTKASRYNTVLQRTNISADIRPGCVNETICTNKSTSYVLGSVSIGGAAHIGCRSGEGIERVESSETYIGNFKIETTIKMKDEMPPAPQNASNASIDWMLCPSSSEPGLD